MASPDRDSRSPERRSASPQRKRSPSRSRSRDRKRSPSGDRRRSRSPRRRSPSPAPRRRSPAPRGDRDRRRSTSPTYRRRSPSPRDRNAPSRRRSRSRSRDTYRERPRYRSRSRDRAAYGQPPRREPPRVGLQMFVAGFNFLSSERDVERQFSKYGRVTEVRIVRDNFGKSRGFGFVAMDNEDDVQDCIRAMNGRDWEGRRLQVEMCKNPK